MSTPPRQNAPPESVPIQIAPAEPKELRPALEIVLQDLQPAARASLVDSLAKLDTEPLGVFEALLVARRGGALVGAAWAQPNAGKTATLWPPQAREAPLDAIAPPLLEEVNRLVDAAGLSMTQALFEEGDDPVLRHLRQAQYRLLAKLAYLQRDLDGATPSHERGRGVGSLEFEVYDENNHQRFKRVVQRTYSDSLDCPDLEGRRDQEDVLAGYRATGNFRPENWRLVRLGGEDVGVLLNTDYDDQQSELVYMGLCPEARRQGWSDALVAESIRLARAAHSQRLCVAVDERNRPAWRTYERHGFSVWAKRHAYVRWRRGAD